ncbi:MAG TPA: hypothetical protein VFT13_00010 [Candidatus Krumholzibacteria bacterium]|nr:hypothetical protein [Candidatus Krumholzibacteria bacterium]
MVVGGGAGGIAAAAIARRRREIIDSFRKARATAPDRGVAESTMAHHDRVQFRHLETSRIIVRTPDGRLYLDEEAEARAGRVVVRVLLAVVVAILIALAWALGLRKGTP